MVKTLADRLAEVIARTHSKKKNDALYITVAGWYCLVTYLPLCRTRDLVTHFTMWLRGTGQHAG